jgi:DNA replication licensing factor MCM5
MTDIGGVIYFGGNDTTDNNNDPVPNTQDGGADYNPSLFPRSPMEAREMFKRFIREFRQGQSFPYMEQLAANWSQGKFFVEVFVQHIEEEAPILAHALRFKPLSYMGPCEVALQQLYIELGDKATAFQTLDDTIPPPAGTDRASQLDQFGFRRDKPRFQLILKSDEIPSSLRKVESRFMEKLVVIAGIIIQAALPEQKAYKIRIRCSKCRSMKDLVLRSGGKSKVVLPRTCDNDVAAEEKCGMDPYVIISEECDYFDVQAMKLQELPEDVPTGETPRTIQVMVNRYLSGRVVAGTRIHAIGILTAEDRSSDRRENGAVKTNYLQVVGIVSDIGLMSRGSSLSISPAEEEKFRTLARSADIRDQVYKSIAPAIKGSAMDTVADVKSAIACLLFGGSRKTLPDGTRLRGDINVLLIGDPGMAKSQFLKFVERAAPISVYTSGKGSSAAGLTAAIVRDSSGRFALEGGAMVLADGGVVCIDEFDKMRPDDRVAIHETMEQQTISISKAGITTILNTRCSVLAAANPMFGSWNSLEETADQMDFATTILSRFDLIFLIKDIRDRERDESIAQHVIGLHQGKQFSAEDPDAPIQVAELRKFVHFAKTRVDPRLSDGAATLLLNHYVKIRDDMREERRGGRKATVPLTVRQLEALARIAEALARMELSDTVSEGHAEEAIRLFTLSTMDAANKNVTTGGSLSEEDRRKVYEIEDAVRRTIHLRGRKRKNVLFKELERQFGESSPFIHQAIRTMVLRGELEEVADNSVVRVR